MAALSMHRCVNMLSLLLFNFVLLAVLMRYYVLGFKDSRKCEATLSTGEWRQHQSQRSTLGTWTPRGCMLHHYTAADVEACLETQTVFFVGDSHARQLYHALLRRLEPSHASLNLSTTGKHASSSAHSRNCSLSFTWAPYLEFTNMTTARAARPVGMIILSTGLWQARHYGEHAVDTYLHSLDNGAKLSKSFERTTLQPPLTFMEPVPLPISSRLNPEQAQTLQPDQIIELNQQLFRTKHNFQVPWAFGQMTLGKADAFDDSGIHFVNHVADTMLDILLNVKCNTVLQRMRGYPMDKTCCLQYPLPTRVQVAALVACSLVIMGYMLTEPFSHSPLPHHGIECGVILAVTFFFAYVADRTHLWNKETKLFSWRDFGGLCLIGLAAGLASIRRRTVSDPMANESKATSKGGSSPDHGFLLREQSDEWKGWMQIFILAYHYTGASQNLSVYKIVRVLVASYLFLTGYGQTIFLLKTGDYSFKRVFATLVRLNFLSATLPYVMNTDYLFYYFTPLSTFWYLTIYASMRWNRHLNGCLKRLLIKIIVAAILANLFIRLPGPLEIIFDFLQRFCHIEWNLHEWRFRLELDSLVVFAGMLLAVSVTTIVRPATLPRSTANVDDLHHQCLRSLFEKLRPWRVGIALAALITYISVSAMLDTKTKYNRYTPVLSILPIASFVILRNSTDYLLQVHCEAFAWVGRVSLETFTLQFHIWLAADTKGRLTTGILDKWFGRYGEWAVLTIVFLWLSKLMRGATEEVTSWLVRSSTSAHDGENSKREPVQSRSAIGGAGAFLVNDLRVRLGLILFGLWVLNMAGR